MNNNLNQKVITTKTGDVNGDNVNDSVYLVGNQLSGPAYEKIMLVIKDGKTGMMTSIKLKDNIGYEPTLQLHDFTGDGIVDILISIATGSSGGTYIYYIYSFVDNKTKLLFDYERYNNRYQYKVNFQDNYRVIVNSERNDLKYSVDLSLRADEYLNEIYNQTGILKQPITGWVDPISGLYPIYNDSKKYYDLLAYQKISGRYHADVLGYVENKLIWNNNVFILDNQKVAVLGVKK